MALNSTSTAWYGFFEVTLTNMEPVIETRHQTAYYLNAISHAYSAAFETREDKNVVSMAHRAACFKVAGSNKMDPIETEVMHQIALESVEMIKENKNRLMSTETIARMKRFRSYYSNSYFYKHWAFDFAIEELSVLNRERMSRAEFDNWFKSKLICAIQMQDKPLTCLEKVNLVLQCYGGWTTTKRADRILSQFKQRLRASNVIVAWKFDKYRPKYAPKAEYLFEHYIGTAAKIPAYDVLTTVQNVTVLDRLVFDGIFGIDKNVTKSEVLIVNNEEVVRTLGRECVIEAKPYDQDSSRIINLPALSERKKEYEITVVPLNYQSKPRELMPQHSETDAYFLNREAITLAPEKTTKEGYSIVVRDNWTDKNIVPEHPNLISAIKSKVDQVHQHAITLRNQTYESLAEALDSPLQRADLIHDLGPLGPFVDRHLHIERVNHERRIVMRGQDLEVAAEVAEENFYRTADKVVKTIELMEPQVTASLARYNKSIAKLHMFKINGQKCTIEEFLEDLKNKLPMPKERIFEHNADLFPSKAACFQKTLNGTISALFGRQLSAFLKPDPEMLPDFENCVNLLMAEIEKMPYNHWVTLEEHLKHNVEPKKRELYAKGWEELEKNIAYYVNCMRFTPNQKGGEVLYENYRTRNIMAPQNFTYLILTALNFDLLHLLKCSNIAGHPIGMVHGASPQELNQLFSKIPRGWKLLSWDGSQHDSHQHKELMDIVDAKFLRMFLAKSMMNKQVPRCVIEQFIENLVSNEFRILVKYPKTNITAVKGKLKGTVFSGHALSTTLGNTLRVLSYVYYVAYRAQVPWDMIQPFVAGDDAVVAIAPEYVEEFENQLHAVYARQDADRVHGLGQVIKMSSYMCSEYMTTFLSRFIYIDPVTRAASSFRLPQRFAHTGHVSTKVAIDKVTRGTMTPEEHATAVYLCMTANEIPKAYQIVADYVMNERNKKSNKAYNQAVLEKLFKLEGKDLIKYKQAKGGDRVPFSREFNMMKNIIDWRARIRYPEVLVDEPQPSKINY